MIELLFIVIVAVVFSLVSKNKQNSPFYWALIGVLYYLIGRLLSVGIVLGVFRIFSNGDTTYNTFIGVMLIERMIGIAIGFVSAFVLGEISGLNIRRFFRDN
jgi:hypothetical protein